MISGGDHVHHHGLLAGIGAGAMAVLAGLALVLIDWHRAAGPVTQVIVTLAWVAVALAVAGFLYAVRWLWHKSRQLAAPPVVPLAGIVPALAEAHQHLHLPPGMTPEAVAAALREFGGQPAARREIES